MRKGMVSYLNMLILAVIVLIVMLSLTKIVTDSFSSSAALAKCGGSLLKSSLLDKGKSFGINQGDFKCDNLPDLTIKKADVSVNGKIKDTAVKKLIADKMSDCWKMVGKGQMDPYKTYDGDTTYCLICSDIIFDDAFKEAAIEQNYKLTDNVYWLATNPIPGLKTTYFEDLFGVAPDASRIRELKDQEIPIDVSQQYVVVWRMETIKNTLAETLVSGATGGALAGILAGKVGGVVGGAIGTLIFPGVGTAVGVAIGVAGFGAGTYGAIKVVNFIGGAGEVSSQILVVPKSQLGKSYEFVNDPEAEPKPFCTKLVNS